MKTSNNFLQILILFFTVSCANISQPTGGPRDTKPPKLLTSVPYNGQRNYTGKTIQLNFNEDINAQNTQEQIIITPLVESNNKVLVKKNKLILTFEKPLEQNTTYTINFRESIKDITESNTTKNLSLSFSTGPNLDSNSITGIIKDINTNLPLENILVGMYPPKDTFQAKTSKPYYFTKTEKDGTYKINNIKNTSYDLIAIQDKNNNLLFNEEEKLGFIKGVKFDTAKTITKEIKVSKFYSIKPQIKAIRQRNEGIEIQLKDAIEVYVLSTDSKDQFYPTISKDGKAITLYQTINSKDSIAANLELTDSVGNKATEKFKFSFPNPKQKPKESIKIQLTPTDVIPPKEAKIKINTAKPIVRINPNKIFIKSDSTISEIKESDITRGTWKWNEIKISSKNNAKDSIQFIFKPGAIETFDTINIEEKFLYRIMKEENYSLLQIKVSTKYPNYLIQLLDKNYNPIDKQKNISTHTYTYLDPGSYYLRAIIDENNNGHWDAGNLVKETQPEQIIYLPNKIDLKANWEVRDLLFEF